jgi:hypothetical protein
VSSRRDLITTDQRGGFGSRTIIQTDTAEDRVKASLPKLSLFDAVPFLARPISWPRVGFEP